MARPLLLPVTMTEQETRDAILKLLEEVAAEAGGTALYFDDERGTGLLLQVVTWEDVRPVADPPPS